MSTAYEIITRRISAALKTAPALQPTSREFAETFAAIQWITQHGDMETLGIAVAVELLKDQSAAISAQMAVDALRERLRGGPGDSPLAPNDTPRAG